MTTPEGRARGEIATRWVELAVAMLFALAGAIVIVDSVRIGYTWAEDGPKAGYFPFYIGCILVACGGYVALQTIWRWKKTNMIIGGIVMSRTSANSRFQRVRNWLWKLKRVSWTVALASPGRK